MNRNDAITRAITNAETAERLLAVDEEPSGEYARTAEEGPYGVYEEQRAARYAGATAHAQIAQAWAAIADRLATPEARARV